jgi:hypothetical protein
MLDKILSFLKKWWPWIVAGVVALIALSSWSTSCRTRRLETEVTRLEGVSSVLIEKAQAAADAYAADKKKAELAILALNEEIAEKNGNIDSLNGVIAGKIGAIKEKEAALAAAVTEGEKQRDAIILSWKAVVADKDEVIAEKDGVIADWSKKYDAEHALRLEGEVALAACQKAVASVVDENAALKKLNRVLERKVARRGALTTIETVAILAGGTYALLKK